MATHFSILAWRTPWTEEPGGLQSMGGQKAGHSQGTNTFTFKHVVGHLKMGSKALGSAKISLTRTGGYFWSTSESSTMREVVCDTLCEMFYTQINWIHRSNNDANNSKTLLWEKVKDYKGKSGASLIAQLVKNLPAVQETPVNSWVRKIHWRRDRLPTLVFLGFPCGSAGKNSTCNAEDLGSIPGLGRSPREGKYYPLQYSDLENSTDCVVHGISKSQT